MLAPQLARCATLVFLTILGSACFVASVPPPAAPPPQAAQAPTSAAAAAPAPPAALPARAAASAAPADEGEPCGAQLCRRFSSAAAALRHVLREQPLMLGLGEAHTPAG